MMTLPRLALLALVLSLCGGAWGQTYSDVFTGAQADWNGDADENGTGDVNDNTANGLNGTAVGTITYADPEAGTTGKSFVFDGSTNYITVPGGVDTDIPGSNGAFTIAARIIPSSVTGKQVIYESGGPTVGQLIYLDGANVIACIIANGSTEIIAVTATGAASIGQETAIVAVFDFEGNVELFIDGESTGTAVLSGVTRINSGTDGGGIGAVGGSTGIRFADGTTATAGQAKFTGTIHRPAIWLSALDADDIRAYQASPQYTSGATLSTAGALDVGTWNTQGNGTITYEWVVANAAGTVIDSGTGDTGTATGLTPGTLYLYVRASNDGGYDIGDHGEREGAYGEANDGYYEVASVTVVNYLQRTRYPWWLRRGAIETPRHYACRIELLGEELCIAV